MASLVVTDAELCAYSADTYSAKPNGLVLSATDDLCAVVYPGSVIAIRGTEIDDLPNLLLDIEAMPEISSDCPLAGRCHNGFSLSAQHLFPLIYPHAIAGGIITGHSLGGAIALALAVRLIDVGLTPSLVVTWEAPRYGGLVLRNRMIGAGIVGRQYRQVGDLVTQVPWWGGVYEDTYDPLIIVGEPTDNLLARHSIDRLNAWIKLHPLAH